MELNASLITWITSPYPTSILFPVLPYHISLLPAVFRFLACVFLVPVLLLTLTDILGWAVFKLVLRPMGYANTLRFKDPNPNSLKIISLATHPPHRSSPTKPEQPEVGLGPSESLLSQSSPLLSSTDTSPSLSYSELSPDPDPDHEWSTPSSTTSSPRLSSLRSLSLPPSANKRPRQRRRSDSSSSTSSLYQFTARATSVGVDGPLLDEGVLMSPQRSDDEEESQGEGLGLLMRTSTGTTLSRRKGVPKAAFAMTRKWD